MNQPAGAPRYMLLPVVRSYLSFHHSALFLGTRSFSSSKHRSGGLSKASEWATYPRSLAAIHRRLQGVVIECRDALEVIRAQDSPDTLFFVDPPYLPDTRSRHKTAYRCELTLANHVALLDCLRAAQGLVVLAGYPSTLYDEHLPGWPRVQRQHRAEGSLKPRTEALWLSPRTARLAHLHPLPLPQR